MKLGTVTSVLNTHTPPRLSESWDNVGVLVEPSAKLVVSRILLTNDLTEVVCREAVERSVQLIIAYHPPIFTPFKRLTQSTAKERIILQCIREGMAVYSPHTALDKIQGGVGDWMLAAFKGVGGDQVVAVINPLPDDETIGSGRKLAFSEKVPLSKCIDLIKSFLNLKAVRVATPELSADVSEHLIASVCVCPGSGASVLRSATGDLLWTGEMSHHEVLDAVSKGRCVVLCEHTHTERGYLQTYRDLLLAKLENKVEILLSTADKEPLSIA